MLFRSSLVTLQLTINQPSSGSASASACASYTWNGTTYTQSGTYVKTLTNAAGCDSIATLVLTIQQPLTPTVTISSSAANPVMPGTSITFTASITNGGTSPVYVWRKNGLVVGGNSPTYTNNSWVDGDLVYVAIVSNATCLTSPTAVSNSIAVYLVDPNTLEIGRAHV